MKQLHRLLPLFVAALAVGAYAQDTSTLKRSPKVGDTAHYKLEATMTLEGAGDGQVTGDMSQKVTKVADNGDYTIEEKTILKATFGGQEVPIPEQTETQTRSALGKLLDVKSDGGDDDRKQTEYRMTALQDFHSPSTAVKVGDTWSFEQKADSNNGNTDTKVDFKVEGAEEVMGHKVFKIHGTGKESGGGDATSDVVYYVDRGNGQLIKAEGNLKHATVGAPTPVDMKFTLSVVE